MLRAVKEMVQSYIEDQQQEKAVNDFRVNRCSLLLWNIKVFPPSTITFMMKKKDALFGHEIYFRRNLAARLRSAPEGRIDEVTVTDWAIQIVDVLDYLHNRQPPIVYRDLNLLIL